MLKKNKNKNKNKKKNKNKNKNKNKKKKKKKCFACPVALGSIPAYVIFFHILLNNT